MSATNGTPNGASRRAFPNGVHCPIVTPFTENEEIDFPALKKLVIRTAKAGMGITLLGTNGEASHLSDSERIQAVKATREALDEAGLQDRPILVGTGTGSAKETVKLCNQAGDAGADYAIVIFPGYFAFAMGKNRAALKAYFMKVLDNSKIPIMIYNFPGAASGIDLDSDFIIELSDHPNCMGTKLTCAGIGKGTRIAAHVQSKEYLARHGPFQVLPGFTDYLLPALVSGHTGCITGTGNVIPKSIVKLYNLSTKAIETGDPKLFKEALELQQIVSRADWCIIKAGIGGTKYALDAHVEKGLGGAPRIPVPEADDAVKKMVDEGMQESLAIERSL